MHVTIALMKGPSIITANIVVILANIVVLTSHPPGLVKGYTRRWKYRFECGGLKCLLKYKKPFQAGQLGDVGGDIRREIAGVILHPVRDALVIYIEPASDLSHGVTFQKKLQSLEPGFLFVPLFFGEGCIATATKSASKALTTGRRAPVTRLFNILEAAGAGGA